MQSRILYQAEQHPVLIPIMRESPFYCYPEDSFRHPEEGVAGPFHCHPEEHRRCDARIDIQFCHPEKES